MRIVRRCTGISLGGIPVALSVAAMLERTEKCQLDPGRVRRIHTEVRDEAVINIISRVFFNQLPRQLVRNPDVLLHQLYPGHGNQANQSEYALWHVPENQIDEVCQFRRG
jgi:hypothetical protein